MDSNGIRLAKRVKTFEPALVEFGRRTLKAHVLDISLRGALVHCEFPPSAGIIATLSCKHLSIAARVAWVKGPKFGVAFLRPMAEHDLLRILAEPDRPAPAILSSSPATPALTANLVMRQRL